MTYYSGGNTSVPSASCTASGSNNGGNNGGNTGGGDNGGNTGGGNGWTCTAGYVALTFDDGPNSGTTTQLINTLTGNGATAVVFPTGQNAQNNASLMQAYKNAGLTIGNHSWDHPHLINMSYNDVQSQLSRTQQVIQQTAGVTPNLFRPPYGETNSTLKQVEQQLGLTEIIWDVDSTDWNNASSSTIRSAASRLTNGQVILMHDWPAATIQALPGILQDLKSRNLCTGTISPSTGRAVAPVDRWQQRRQQRWQHRRWLVHRHGGPGRVVVRPLQRHLHGVRRVQLVGDRQPGLGPVDPELVERHPQREHVHLERQPEFRGDVLLGSNTSIPSATCTAR